MILNYHPVIPNKNPRQRQVPYHLLANKNPDDPGTSVKSGRIMTASNSVCVKLIQVDKIAQAGCEINIKDSNR